MYATISADIVSSTSLPIQSTIELNESLKKVLKILESNYRGFWGRVVRGDTVECVLENPEYAVEIAIMLKCWVKAFKPADQGEYFRFKKYGLRLAIGIGEMSIIDRDRDILDGDAIYRSGRLLDKLAGRSKYSMVISMDDHSSEETFNVVLSLINQLLNNATSRRCLTLCERLLSSSSSETAERMGITTSGVNQTLNELGWGAIEQAITYYRTFIVNHVK